MYAKLMCRLIGWVFLGMGIAGFLWGQIGDYMHLSTYESILNLIIGIISIFAARRRHRVATLVAFVLGVLLLTYGVSGMFMPSIVGGLADPLESLLRIIAGGWAIYVAIQDILTWRALPPTAS